MIDRVEPDVFRLHHPVKIPGVPPINIYVLLGEEPALVDCGPDDPELFDELTSELREIGLAWKDVRHLIITHAHVDHFGMARRVRQATPLAIHVHPDDIPKCTARPEERADYRKEFIETVLGWGVPEETLTRIGDKILAVLSLGPPLDRADIDPLRPGELRLGEQRYEVRHCPGHTEGCVCLLRNTLLFAGDHLLEDITSNPSLYLPRYHGWRTGLRDYMASLDNVRDGRRILPGHGTPYDDASKRIDEIRAAYGQRRERILGMLNGAAHNVMGLAMEIWSGLNPITFFLGCREVHGHLEILESDGLVEVQNGMYRRKT